MALAATIVMSGRGANPVHVIHECDAHKSRKELHQEILMRSAIVLKSAEDGEVPGE